MCSVLTYQHGVAGSRIFEEQLRLPLCMRGWGCKEAVSRSISFVPHDISKERGRSRELLTTCCSPFKTSEARYAIRILAINGVLAGFDLLPRYT